MQINTDIMDSINLQMLYDCFLSGLGVLEAFCTSNCDKCEYKITCRQWHEAIDYMEKII